MRPGGDRTRGAGHPARTAGAVAGLAGLLGIALGHGGCRDRGEPIAPGLAFRVEVSADSVSLGDPVELRMRAVVPSGARPIFPGGGRADGDSIGPWRILERGNPVRREQGGWQEVTQTVKFSVYRLGSLGPDTLRLGGTLAGGDSIRLLYAVDPVRVIEQIHPGEGADASKARDIQDVVATGPRRWPYFVAAGGLMLALVIAGLRWLRRRRRAAATFVPQAPPGPTPEEEFESAIERLLASGLLEQGLVREFYYEVSRAVRLYLERVHGLPLLESTSTEVAALLNPRLRAAHERDALVAWLREGDLVKYARLDRLQAEALGYLETSRGLVRVLASGRAT